MRHLTIAVALTTLLAGCFGSGGGGGHSTTFLTITETGVGYSVIVGASVPFDLVVSGTSGTVTVAPNQTIRGLTISGPDSDVFIGSSSTVSRTVALSGTNAVLHLPPGSTIAVNVTGVGCQVLYDAVGG
jgi:hypothetical protein